MAKNPLLKKYPTIPTNDRQWSHFLNDVLSVVTGKLTSEGDLTDEMKIESRDETVTNVVQNLDGSGNATNSLELASRGESLNGIVQRLNAEGHAIDSFQLESRGVSLVNVLQKITDNGQLVNMTAFRQRQLLGTFVGANPISATDAGSDATINIVAFTWRVAGKPDASYNSGSITGLSYETTYYITGSGDPNHTGATLTYEAKSTFEDTLNDQDDIYFGFVTTPAALGGDTGGGGGYEP